MGLVESEGMHRPAWFTAGVARDDPRRVRWTTLVAIGLVLATMWIWALANAVLVTQTWEFDDVRAYLSAANRLLDGAPLYISGDDASDLYLYAPWFAAAWVPLTFISRPLVEVGWAAILIVCLFACLLPLRRTWAGLALALLLGGMLYRTVGWGNVQPLLLAALIYLLPTRAGPWVVGVAGSLKPWPLLVVAVFAWRREWSSVVISIVVAGVLWLPALLFNWTDYPTGERPPNLYDATFLLLVPALLDRASARPTRARPARNQSDNRAAGAG